MNPLIAEFLQGTAARKYTYTSNGIVHEVDACVYTFAEKSFDALEFYRERLGQFRRESVSWFYHMRFLSQLYTVEKTLKMVAAKVPHPDMIVADDYWLIMNRSLDCQLSFLDNFGYSDGSPTRNEQMNECKILLTAIAQHHPFQIMTVMNNGGVSIVFDKKPKASSIEPFFDATVEFMKKYNRLEFSPSSLRRQICRGSVVI